MTVAVQTASPRLYTRHARHARFARVLRNEQQLAWLETQANRLSSTTTVVFGKLAKYTADQIQHAANLAAIP